MKLYETYITDWNRISELEEIFINNFVFRGQCNSKWQLTTSIERISELSRFDDFKLYEKWMIDEFRKKYHLYTNHIVEDKNWFEFLALMQHYGSPTRLLDFTKSFYIASYFATISATTDSSIWAVNHSKLVEQGQNSTRFEESDILPEVINEKFVSYLNESVGSNSNTLQENLILPIQPINYSDRLNKQQGLFLASINSESNFMDNLTCTFGFESDVIFEQIEFSDLLKLMANPAEKIKYPAFADMSDLSITLSKASLYDSIGVIKFNIPIEEKKRILRKLIQMNITAEVLFPGLEGLAKSLIQTQILT